MDEAVILAQAFTLPLARFGGKEIKVLVRNDIVTILLCLFPLPWPGGDMEVAGISATKVLPE